MAAAATSVESTAVAAAVGVAAAFVAAVDCPSFGHFGSRRYETSWSVLTNFALPFWFCVIAVGVQTFLWCSVSHSGESGEGQTVVIGTPCTRFCCAQTSQLL